MRYLRVPASGKQEALVKYLCGITYSCMRDSQYATATPRSLSTFLSIPSTPGADLASRANDSELDIRGLQMLLDGSNQ